MKKVILFIPIALASLFLISLSGVFPQNALAQEVAAEVYPPPFLELPPSELVLPDSKSSSLEKEGGVIESVSSASLETGDDQVHGLVFYNGFLWASTRTYPPRILKIDPANFSVEGRIDDLDFVHATNDGGEDIIAANNYIWVIRFTHPARLVRVDPSSMDYQQFTLSEGDVSISYGTSLEYAFGSLWVGGYNKIAQVNINVPSSPTFQVHDYSGLVELPNDYMLVASLASSPTRLWAVFRQVDYPSFTNTKVLQIDPANPGSAYTHTTIDTLFPDDMLHTNSHLYLSSEATGSSDAFKIANDLTYINNPVSNSTSYGAFRNPLDPEHFWGAYVNSPGKLIKFDLDLNPILTLTLPDSYNDPSEVAFDEAGNMYVTTWQTPSGVVKYTAPAAVTLSISKSGSDVVLSWNSVPEATAYQVWRSTSPYFTPGEAGSTKLTEDNITSYTDAGAIGDTSTNYYYGVKAVNDNYGLVSPISNRVGEFDYTLNETVQTDYTWIALPLSNMNITNASDLAFNIENNSNGSVLVQTISRWNAQSQSYDIYYHQFQFGNYPIQNQNAYRVEVDVVNGSSVVWSLIGNVPLIDSYTYTLYETVQTDYTWIMQPLDFMSISSASLLSTNIELLSSPAAMVQTLARWNSSGQSLDIYYHQFSFGDFPTRPGYPYRVEVDVSIGDSAIWP